MNPGETSNYFDGSVESNIGILSNQTQIELRYTLFLRSKGASSVETRSSSSSTRSPDGPPISPFLEWEEDEYVRVGFRLPPLPSDRRGIGY